jgi:hypothetical protein
VAEVTLDEWEVTYADEDPFMAPEQTGIVLVGKVTGHPKKPDGTRVSTSRVLRAKGRRVSTESGTVYLLREPSAEYRAWLAEHRPNWDPENPIVLLSRHAVS